jgi:hypothetical protein
MGKPCSPDLGVAVRPPPNAPTSLNLDEFDEVLKKRSRGPEDRWNNPDRKLAAVLHVAAFLGFVLPCV